MTAIVRAAPSAPALSADDPVDTAARVVLRFHVRRFGEHASAARAGDVEAVHQLRVATRRLRAAFRLFGPLLPPPFVRVMQRDLAWLADAIGAVRDLDVLTALVMDQATRLTPESRRALGPLALALHDERQTRHAALLAALDSARCRRLLDRLAAFADGRSSPTAARLATVAPRLVRPLLRAVLRSGRRLAPETPATGLHRLRVRAKRLRYALETLRGPTGKGVQRAVRHLVRLQEILGEGQDATVAIAWLRAFAQRTDVPPETLAGIGGLIELIARRARKRRRRIEDAWEDFDRARVRGALVDELETLARRRPSTPIASVPRLVAR